MPSDYVGLRLKMACSGLEHENYVQILEQKIRVLGGMHSISADNTNKSNKNRSENFSEYISKAFPYIETAKSKPSGGLESLIEKYHELFGKDGKIKPTPAPTSTNNA